MAGGMREGGAWEGGQWLCQADKFQDAWGRQQGPGNWTPAQRGCF